MRGNILISRFKYCSWQVKVKLFQTYCLCLHNPGLWHSINKATIHRFYSCYDKSVKRFFGFAKYSSLTSALLQTGLPSCTTVIQNFKFRFSTTGWSKNLTPFVLYGLISSNIYRFSNLFHCQNQENICNNTVTKDPTTPKMCRYTTL